MRGIAVRAVVLGLAAAGAASAVAFPLLRGPLAPAVEALPRVPPLTAPAVTVAQKAPGHSLAGPRPIPGAHPTRRDRPQPAPRAVPTAPPPASGVPVARRSRPPAAQPRTSAKPRAEQHRAGDSVGLPASVERHDAAPADPPQERHTKD